jgi:hypothetical protein
MLADGLSLVGFMDEKREALAYLEQRCMIGGTRSRDDLAAHWKAAKAKIAGPVVTNPGKPEIRDFPSGHDGLKNTISGHPRFLHEVMKDVRSFDFKLVEINPLLAFQRDTVVDNIAVPIGDIFSLCLPDTIKATPSKPEEIPAKDMPEGVDGAFRIVSPELNLRVVGCDDATLTGSTDVKLAGAVYGTGIPWVQVTSFKDQCYLSNGYHRALWLNKAGYTHIPCLCLEVTKASRIGIKETETLSRDLFFASVKPTVGHYTSDRAYPVRLRMMERVIEIAWRVLTRPQK